MIYICVYIYTVSTILSISLPNVKLLLCLPRTTYDCWVRGVLSDRQMVHFVDNTSAVAALTKGYSRVPDSARLVHGFHAWCAAARAHAWFEYVPSAANAGDLPSRDMSLAARAMHLAGEVASAPRRVRFPSLGDLDDPRGWMREAAAAAQAAA